MSREWDHNDKINICQQYPSTNICQINQSWEQYDNHSLGCLYNTPLLVYPSNRRHNCQPKHNVAMYDPLCAVYHVTGTLLFYILPRLHRVTLHSTTSVPCYFTFHQDCTLLFYSVPRLNIFWSSVTKAHFIIPKPVAPKSACLIARVHHIVTTGVGNYSNATDCTCVMFTPISIISQMIQMLKCGRQAHSDLTDLLLLHGRKTGWKDSRDRRMLEANWPWQVAVGKSLSGLNTG
jgi:hypothetical protein